MGTKTNNIVFMGTPDFARVSLQALYDRGFSVQAVFCQPDKPKNRGMKLLPCPVKEAALGKETKVFQPVTLKDGEVEKLLQELKPDVIAVVAYGKLLPKTILEIPRLGCINIHGSLLPKYRGSAPIQWTVLNGEPFAGVTAMFMSEKLDAGDIIDSVQTEVLPGETAGELFERLAPLGGELLCNVLEKLFSGNVGRTPQDEKAATYAPPLTREMSPIDWNKKPLCVLNQINGLSPWPMATTEINGTVFKIYRAEEEKVTGRYENGTLLAADKKGLLIACSGGGVRITELQAPGGKRMKAADYLRGHPICL